MYAVPNHAVHLVALLELLDRPAALVGASLGGGALTVVGSPYPAERARVAALVLVDVAPRLEAGGRSRVRGFVEAHAGFTSVEEAAELVAAYVGGKPRPGRGMTSHLRQSDDDRSRWMWDPRMVADGFDSYDEGHVEQQFASARRLEAATLLLRGGRSDVTTPQSSAEFLAAVPHATHREIPEAGHMVSAVPNDSYVAAVLEFLAALELPGGFE
jgi:pimeloyl-ACP methyl ester carboxylesterase